MNNNQVKEIDSYKILMKGVPGEVRIIDAGDYVSHYEVSAITFDAGTEALMDEITDSLAREVSIETSEILDARLFEKTREKFLHRAKECIRENLPKISEEDTDIIGNIIVADMMELGELEYLLADDNLEEVVVNSSTEVVWVFIKNGVG